MEEHYYLKKLRSNHIYSLDNDYEKVIRFIDRKIYILQDNQDDKFSLRYLKTLQDIRNNIFFDIK